MDAATSGGGAERLGFREFEKTYREGKARNGAIKIAHMGHPESCAAAAPGSTVGSGSGILPASAPGGPCVVERLQRKFGLGDQPKKRLVLYRRLERLAALHGELVLALISEAVCCAVGKDKPGRYFCRAICAKLAEAGITEKGSVGDAAW